MPSASSLESLLRAAFVRTAVLRQPAGIHLKRVAIVVPKIQFLLYPSTLSAINGSTGTLAVNQL